MRSFLSSSLSFDEENSSISTSTPLLIAVFYLGTFPFLVFLAFLVPSFDFRFFALALLEAEFFAIVFALAVELSACRWSLMSPSWSPLAGA